MTASHAERARRPPPMVPFAAIASRVFVLALVAVLAVPQARAQIGGPIQIGPPPAESPPDPARRNPAPATSTPEIPAAGNPEPEPAETATPSDVPQAVGTEESEPRRRTADGAIRIDELRPLTVDAVGTLTPEIGGLAAELWQGTPGPVAIRVTGLMPATLHSPAIRDLMRRQLLTTGPAPEDLDREGALLTARAERLLAIGAVDDLHTLLAGVAEPALTGELRRILSDAALSRGDDATACRLFDGMVATGIRPYWMKVGIICDKRAGRDAKVDFGVRLMQELGVEDPLFFALARAATSASSGAAFRMGNAEPVHLALARAAGLAIDPDIATIDSLPVLVALARGAGAPPFPIRLAAAEKAERYGALSAREVTALYDEVAVQVASVDGAIAIAESDEGPLGRAILWRAAQAQSVPIARAQAVARALELAETGSAWRQTARLFAPLLASLTPGPELDWLADDVARALIAAGEVRATGPWIDRLQRLALTQAGDSERILLRLWPLLHLAGGDAVAAYDQARIGEWWADLRETDIDGATSKATLALLLMDALDSPVGDGVWRDLVVRPTVEAAEIPAPALRLAVRAAGAAGRVGETAALSAVVLGHAPLINFDPTAVAEVVGALVAVGLEAEARRIAVETALVHGL